MKSLQKLYFSNLNVVCNTGGNFLCPTDFSWKIGTHSFEQNKFYFITHGECIICVGGIQYTARAGQWFFIPAGAQHSYHNIKGCTFQKFWMHFDLYPSADLFSMLDLPYFVTVPENSAVYDLFRKASDAMHSDNLTQQILLKTYLLRLLCEYINLVHPNGVAVKNTDNRINQILRFINDNLSKTLTVQTLAETFHLHPTHFIRFFREKTGETPARYVRIRRMESAKQMLDSTDLPIASIMEKLGFSDESQFSKQFKKYYGQSPRNHRNYFRNHL